MMDVSTALYLAERGIWVSHKELFEGKPFVLFGEPANCKPSARIRKVMLSNGEICAYNMIFRKNTATNIPLCMDDKWEIVPVVKFPNRSIAFAYLSLVDGARLTTNALQRCFSSGKQGYWYIWQDSLVSWKDMGTNESVYGSIPLEVDRLESWSWSRTALMEILTERLHKVTAQKCIVGGGSLCD